MPEESLITVLVPVYKVEKYLSCCIESIIHQTYKNLEIILIDDGSPDNCPCICDCYAAQDSRIQVIHQKNRGSAAARNAGLERATGEFIIFIDSDDFVHSEMLSDLYAAVNREKADMAMCGFICVNEECNRTADMEKMSGEHRLNDEVICADEYWNYYYNRPDVAFIAVWNKLIRREVYENVRFKEGKTIDDEFVIHYLISRCERIVCVKENLYYYRKRSGSVMSSAFSINHLDVIEARVDRALFFVNQNRQRFAEKSVTYAISELMDSKKRIDLKNQENSERFKKLRNMCKAAGREVVKRNASKLFKVAYLGFCMGDTWYLIMMKIRRIGL